MLYSIKYSNYRIKHIFIQQVVEFLLLSYKEHISYTYDTCCQTVIHHASFDADCMLAGRWKRVISLEYLIEEKFVLLSTTDEYFQAPDYGETYPFSLRGKRILLNSCSLMAAFARLPKQTQKEIGEQSG